MSAPDSIKAIYVKENSLLITKLIFVCHFWKITLSIKLKKFCLLFSFFETSFSNEGGSIMGLENSFKFILSAIFCSSMSRAIHGSGGSGLCLTCNRPVRDQVSKNPTYNRPIKRFRFRGLDVCRVGSVSGEAETRRKPLKIGEILPDLAKIRWDLAGSGRDFFNSDDFSPKPCWESPDLLYLCQIWLFWLTKSAKLSWNLVEKLENSPECSCSSGGSGFTGFEGGDSKSTRQRQVLELKTRIWPPEQSDQVEEGRVRAV